MNLLGLLLLGLATIVVAASGCVTKAKARADALAAYRRGVQDGVRMQQQSQRPPITVRGDVRNGQLQWREGLTLSRALVEADYRGVGSPRNIIVTRNGESYAVHPRQLLSGAQDPLLEPGDQIEVVR
ncbi:MAG TPA: hypothetical protein VNO52_10005 [Methylomirabilota bacterium]|nr:hypothetical protein [Methylomirabilota bacterium]